MTNQSELDIIDAVLCIAAQEGILLKNDTERKAFHDGFRHTQAYRECYDYITANYTPKKHLVELLNLIGTPTCESLHHPKKYQHRALEVCPVVERIAELQKGQV